MVLGSYDHWVRRKFRNWRQCPWISYVEHVDIIIQHHDHNSTRPCFIMRLVRRWGCCHKKIFFSLLRTLDERFLNVIWEFWLQNYVIVQVIFQIFCTLTASMSIVNSKNLKSRPQLSSNPRLFGWRLYHIQYYWDSVFICFPNCTDISICCKCLYGTECFLRNFTRLEKWKVARRLLLFCHDFCYVLFNLNWIVSIRV